MKQSKPKSSVIYQGPSLIDGSPIVCIAIIGSGNVKTGSMIQTYIIRSDISPMEASKSGLDYAICGNKSTCIDCGLCKGSSVKAKSIAIVAHGRAKANIQ